VEQRVEELADRPEGFEHDNAIGFMRLLPLSEIIATVLDTDSPYAQKVWDVYNPLVEKFGDEYKVLIDASKEELSAVAGEEVADAVVKVRRGKARVVPGYDGVYGQLILSNGSQTETIAPRRVQQLNLTDFTL
jgi:DNA helicase-2/ATP-dependent DNA helicase PcrA